MEASAAAVVAAPGGRRVLRDYLELTKPKVQSLLLFTTVTTMYVAGDPSLGLILLTCLGGALSAGGAGAINHAVDRDIDRTMARTADRPVASGPHLPRRGDRLRLAARPRLLPAAGAHRQPAGGGALALRPARLRLRLHALAQAHARRRTSSSAAPPGRCRRWSPGRRSPAASAAWPSSSSRSSSSGRRRTSGRSRC